MKETFVTVSGVVATKPRAVMIDGTLPVTSFRLASTSRRYDRQAKDWVDGHTTWMTVTCWRALAVNVAKCVVQKDLVVVHGQLRTPEWTGDGGVRRSGVEVDADSIGHDLTFGISRFERQRRAEPMEIPGRREADALARAVELDALAADLSALLEPPSEEEELEAEMQAEFEDSDSMEGELVDAELQEVGR